MTTDAQLRVDGVWLGASGLPFGDLAWTDRADGGNFECSWDLTLSYGERPAPLFKGAKVEVFLGPSRRWYGELTDTDWDGGSFTATGMSQRSYDFAARTSGGVKTTTPDIAINESTASDGWLVTKPVSFSNIPVTAAPSDSIISVGTLLDQAALDFGFRWGVWGDGIVRTYYAPTIYDYLLAPGVIDLGETTEDTFTRVVAQYLDATSGQVTLIGVGPTTPPVRHTLQDYTSKGPISAATATALAQAQLLLGLSSPGWTSAATVSSSQLLTPGGLPADLASVTAGQMVRAVVLGDYGQSYRDLVIGETKYTAGDDVLSLSPVGKVATSLSEVFEDTYARLTGQPVAS